MQLRIVANIVPLNIIDLFENDSNPEPKLYDAYSPLELYGGYP
jgi:hypothetical protein